MIRLFTILLLPLMLLAFQNDAMGKSRKYQRKYNFELKDAELTDAIKMISSITKKNFIISNKVRGGKVTILSPRKVTANEAWEAFLSTLRVNNYSVIQTGKFYKVIQARNSRKQNSDVYGFKEKTPYTDNVVTKLIKPEHIQVDQIQRTIRSMVSPEGELIFYNPTNTLIISDTATNIQKIEKIISYLDLPGGKEALWVLPVKFTTAKEISQKIQEILDQSGTKNKSSSKNAQDGNVVQISRIIADDRTNQLIFKANDKGYQEVKRIIDLLDVAIPGQGQIHVYYLQNASAEQIAGTLSSLVGGNSQKKNTRGLNKKAASKSSVNLIEGDVKITADKFTNSLIIVANPSDYNNLVKVIRSLDIRRKQVFVEAIIMEVTIDKSKDLGFAFSGGSVATIGGESTPVFAGTAHGGLNPIAIDPTSLASIVGFVGGVRGPEIEGNVFGSSGPASQVKIPSFGLLLKALQRNGDVEILSTPHILTLDNEEAQIIVGQNIPVPAGFTSNLGGGNFSSLQPAVSIQRQDVALQVKLKPQANNNNLVKLNVSTEVSEILSIDKTLGPTTSKRSAKTSIVVSDQQTAVIGGLMRTRTNNNDTRVPILGDLPLLGFLFRGSTTSNSKTNLIMVLTPYIISNERDFRNIYTRKMKEREEYLKRFYGTTNKANIYIDYSKKIGPLQVMLNKHAKNLSNYKAGETDSEDGKMIIAPEVLKNGEQRQESPEDATKKESK